MASLSLKNVTKVYKGNVKAVDNFTMDIEDGEFIVFVETIKDSVTGSLKISKVVGIYNKLLQNSVLRFNVTVIYAPTINSCK